MKKIYIFVLNLVLTLSIHSVSGQNNPEQIDSLTFCKKGDIFLTNYQFEKAIESLTLCYRQDLQNIEYLKKIALCYSNMGQLKDAKINYLEILKIDSNNILSLNQLGVSYLKESNYKQSLLQYIKLEKLDPLNSYYQKKIAKLSFKSGKIENSILHYKKAHKLNPKDIDVIIELSQIYQSLKLYSEADNLINKGRLIDSTNTKLILYQVKSAYKQKSYLSVILGINQILKTTKDSTSNLLRLFGVSSFHTGDYQNTITSLEKVIENKQESEIVYYYLGLAYRAIGNGDKSIYHFERAINESISDNISIYYTNLAVTYEEQGMYAESIKAYQTSYKSSKDKILLYHLARNYDMYYKNTKTAILYYERYLATNDSANIQFKDYSKYRVSELKTVMHFNIDTLE
jgi:tetratricopeptide (TPR) repeat protein